MIFDHFAVIRNVADLEFVLFVKLKLLGAAAYQLGNTSSRMITEVNQCYARLVLGWDTVHVQPECCC